VSVRRLALVGAGGLLFAAASVTLVNLVGAWDSDPARGAAAVVAGLIFVATGLVALWRRPWNYTGRYLVAIGYLWYLGSLGEVDNSWLFSIGLVVGSVCFVPFAKLILAFPSGRLQSRLEQWIVAATAVSVVGFPLAVLLLDEDPFEGCENCPENALAVANVPGVATAFEVAGAAAAVAIGGAILGLLVRRWWRSSPARRRSLTPVLATSCGALVVLVVGTLIGGVSPESGWPVEWLFIVAFAAVPVSVLFGVLRSKLARGSVAELVVALGEGSALRDALAEALGDPTLEVGYWLDREQRFVDAEGMTLETERRMGRATTLVERDGRRVAALVHEASLADEPELVQGVAAAAALALDNERLTAELRAQYQVLITAVNTSPALLCVLDTEGRIRNFNHAVERATGLDDPEAIRDTPFWDIFIDPSERKEMLARFRAAAPDFPPAEYENAFVNARGERLVIAWSAAPLHDDSGRTVGIVAGGLDITERHRHEAELERERTFLNAIANNAPSLLALVDENGIVVPRATNVTFEELLEYDPDETGDVVFWERYVDPAEADDVRQEIERVVRGEDSEEFDNHWVSSTGRRLLVAWCCTRLPKIDERELFLISGADITERERRERELRKSEARLRGAIEGSPVAIIESDTEGNVITWNPAAQQIFGWAPEEILGKPIPFVPPERQSEFRHLFQRTSAGEVITGFETVRMRKDGKRVDVSVSAALIRDASGAVASHMALFLDITDRKRRELELQRERDFLDTLADAIPSLLVVVDTEAQIVEDGVNRMFSETFGWSAQEAVGRSFLELVDPEDEYAVRMAIAAAANGVPRTDLEARWLRQDGEARIVAWTATPLLEARDRPLVLITGADVTEQRRQQEEIRASRSRLVEAHELERRRLERNLHDGAQQRLVALAVSLRLIESRLDGDSADAREILSSSREELDLALAELRELARGIHPAVLTDRGLGAALDALAARTPVPVEVTAPEERLPEQVEAAVYYVASEALTNVTKYAQASEARVVVARENGRVVVEVADDGVGGADAARGSGLRGLSDRVGALDGRLAVESPPGGGTRILAEIPLGPE
jgi:PAS domain S-box-containing protein